jgi:heme/copper-type cytochrome/quinol oxidase subunit 3
LSFCNAIMKIPLLKASLGTIIQLCIPIFFLSFLTLVEFLYATSTTLDQVRGQKIGSSTLIVATYISFIYLMRTVIPPTPSWSLFEVAVCLLAALCLFPIFQSIYESNINNVGSPFGDGLFIASFFLIISLCALIVMMLIVIKFYMARKIKRYRSTKV